MIGSVVVLLRQTGAGRDALLAAIDAEADRVHASLADRAGARVRAFEVIDGGADGTSHAQTLHGEPFDAAIEAAWEGAELRDLVDVFAGLAERAGGALDHARSFALAGTVYPFTPRETETVTFVGVSRPWSMTWTEHHDHWLNRHGWVVKPGADARGSGYRQFHADPRASSYAARAAGLGRHELEGLAIAYFDDLDAYRRVMVGANPRVLEDEARFIDPEESVPGVYRVRRVLEQARGA